MLLCKITLKSYVWGYFLASQEEEVKKVCSVCLEIVVYKMKVMIDKRVEVIKEGVSVETII